MPTFTMTKNWDDGQILTESQLDDIKSSVETFLNTTKLDSDNIQDGGIDSDAIAALAVTTAKIANSAVETAKINDGAVTAAKLASATRVLKPGDVFNIGLEAAQGSVAADSIRITSADGSDLSASNVGYICLPGTTAGTVVVFSLTANVTILLTAAHWGMGTLGDRTDVELRVYAINDNGTLKFGVSNTGGYRTITTALSSQTHTDINLATEMLVNSTLTGTSACREIGWFLGDFDDTGGSSEDLWVVQTGAGEINVGVPVKTFTDWVAYTPTCNLTINATTTGKWRREGDGIRAQCKVTFSAGNSEATTCTFTIPNNSTWLIDTAKFMTNSTSTVLGFGTVSDANGSTYDAFPVINTSTTVLMRLRDVSGTYATYTSVNTNGNIPITIAASDFIQCEFWVPILGMSTN